MSGGAITFTYPLNQKSIGGFEIDAFVVEKYSFANKVTTQKVEGGASITHITEEPDTISIEAFIGNAKFEAYTGEMPDDLSALEPADPKERIRYAYHELLRMKRERKPVALVTGLDTFTDMIITDFSIDRNAETGADLPFSMTFQNIKMIYEAAAAADTADTPANAAANAAAADTAAATANAGVTGKDEANPKENFVERTAYNDWKRTGGSYPTAGEFTKMFGETPQQFVNTFGEK
jgi:hypothetical protein